ncbi:F-box protein At5g49610-like [Bidens hawaiensis]|uniref:F-box protein At5g49610-like n=1 Tax=Bidens hawaiensis TaxID=980011 RepID=UPI00404955F9
MGDQFPPDVIYGILSRLPIKSLARFRCVCKSWLKYINHPYLQTIHRFKEEPTPVIFQLLPSADSNMDTKLCKISFLHVDQNTMTMKKDPVLDVPYKIWPYQTPVLGSCNGLTLVWYENAPSPWHGILLTLINPLTKQRHDLPPVKPRATHWDRPGSLQATGIGFDDSANTLTTVCVLRKESFWLPGISPPLCTMVHRSGMSTWREIPQTRALPIRDEGVFAHGRLHWLSNGTEIAWFDVKTEEFGLTDAPKRGQYGQLVDLNGEVGFAYKDDGMGIELWILKREEWVLRCRFDLDLPRYIDVVVCGCWNDDGDILLTSNGGKRLFVYTLKTDDLKEVELDGRCEADIRMHRSRLFSIRGQKYKKSHCF